MKLGFAVAVLGTAVAVAAYAAETEHDKHVFVTEAQIAWKDAPNTLPGGGQFAVLYGNPNKDGMFAMRIKMPKGFRIAPHTHPKPEILTVISGTFRLGMGAVRDDANAKILPAGSFSALAPGVVHYAFVEEETVVQINSMGPWAITYVNPADDPRRRSGAN